MLIQGDVKTYVEVSMIPNPYPSWWLRQLLMVLGTR